MKAEEIRSNRNSFIGNLYEDKVVIMGEGNLFQNCSFKKGIDIYGEGNTIIGSHISGTINGFTSIPLDITYRVFNR